MDHEPLRGSAYPTFLIQKKLRNESSQRLPEEQVGGDEETGSVQNAAH